MRHIALLVGLLFAAGPAWAETQTYLCTMNGLGPRPDSKLVLDLSARRSVRTDTNAGVDFAPEALQANGQGYDLQGQQDGVGGKVVHHAALDTRSGVLTEYYVMANGRRYGDSTSKCRPTSSPQTRK